MRVFIREDYDEISKMVAEYVSKAIARNHSAGGGKMLNVAFSSGFSVQVGGSWGVGFTYLVLPLSVPHTVPHPN